VGEKRTCAFGEIYRKDKYFHLSQIMQSAIGDKLNLKSKNDNFQNDAIIKLILVLEGMMPLNSKHIEGKIISLNDIIRELEPCFKERKPDDVFSHIRFPWGIIHSTNDYRKYFPFIQNSTLKTNIAYTLQLTDVFKWIIRWFDLKGVVREMLIKTGIIIFTCIQEALAYDFVDNYVSEAVNKKYSKNLDKLLKFKIITQDQYKDFDRCRRKRDDIHLHRLVQPEREKYTLNDYNYAGGCINKMKNIFLEHYNSAL
jgi:hypothetical protein